MRKRSTALLVAGACVLQLSAPGPAHAQVGIGQVNGTVFGKDRKGVPGLAIAIVPETGDALFGTSTDRDGRYGMKGMPPGSYSIILATPSGMSRKDGIRIRPLFRSIVDFNLGAEPLSGKMPTLKGTPSTSTAPAAAPAPAASPGEAPPSPGVAPAPDPTVAPAAPAASLAHAAGAGEPSSGPSPRETSPPPSLSILALTQSISNGAVAPAGAATLAVSFTLQGPERSSAPDAWVAVIPVQGAGVMRRTRTDHDGAARLEEVPAGTYSALVKATGFMTWRIGPITVEGAGELKVVMSLVPFPMGFPGTIEDALIPIDPIPTFQNEAGAAATGRK